MEERNRSAGAKLHSLLQASTENAWENQERAIYDVSAIEREYDRLFRRQEGDEHTRSDTQEKTD